MPAFNDLIIYQFHIGTYYGTDSLGNDIRPSRVCTFLDVLDRLEYLVDLGINALEPLPVVEFPTETSMGYNGTDYFSPEMEYVRSLPGRGWTAISPWSTNSFRVAVVPPSRRARSTARSTS